MRICRYVGNWGYDQATEAKNAYARARYLQFARGAWMSRDPFPQDRVFTYGYALNNPPRNIDPSCKVDCSTLDGWGPFATAYTRACNQLRALSTGAALKSAVNTCIANSGWCGDCTLSDGSSKPKSRTFQCLTNLCNQTYTDCNTGCCGGCASGFPYGGGVDKCKINVCWTNISGGNCQGELGVALEDRLWLHEIAHCCGFGDDNPIGEDAEYPNCNDVVACCIDHVSRNIATNECYIPLVRAGNNNCKG